MTKTKLFISYRRSDAIDTVRALYFQLRLRFGSSKVFMDVSAIRPGDIWPERLQLALDEASIVFVVIGPGWLTAADQYGRRRIDSESDWVRLEIESALNGGRKKVIPLLVGGLRELPPAEALPTSLVGLLEKQAHVLSDANWETDVQLLANVLIDGGFQAVDQNVVNPLADKEKQKKPPLTEEELFAALQRLPGWEPVETSIPRDYPKSRHELRRGLRFNGFKPAIAFLQTIVEPLNKLKHHPRIENQWRTVFIHFTTWDVGNRITAVDVDAAHIVDELYKTFTESVAEQTRGKAK